MKPGTLLRVAREGSGMNRLRAARDGQAAIRLLATGALLETRLLDTLAAAGPSGRSTAEAAAVTGLTDLNLAASLLATGEAYHLVHRDGDRWSLTRTGRGLVHDDTARAMVTGLGGYHLDLYRELPMQLRGGPGRADLELHAELIARISSAAAPFVRDAVVAAVTETNPHRILDIGCGEGDYLTAMLQYADQAIGVGLEQDPRVAALAEHALASAGIRSDRAQVVGGVAPEDLGRAAEALGGQADLVLLANSIYYIPPADRVPFLRSVVNVTAPGGLVLIVTTVSDPSATSRHLALLFRAQATPMILPTAESLACDVRDAGLLLERVRRITPGEAMYAVACRVPAAHPS